MEKHDLLHEFPEYDNLEHRIHRMKTDIEVITDEALKELKAHMLHLKDAIYSMLKH